MTYGRNYDGSPAAERPWREEFTAPEIVWVPSIALFGMTFSTGDAFPASLLRELHQRIRDVRQGPDGFLYVLTEEADGALLRIEPAR